MGDNTYFHPRDPRECFIRLTLNVTVRIIGAQSVCDIQTG